MSQTLSNFTIEVPDGFEIEFDRGQRTGSYSNLETHYRLVGPWVTVPSSAEKSEK